MKSNHHLSLRRLLMALALLIAAPLAGAAETVDINTAGAAELAAAISGIGMKRAEEVIAYREANGPFTRIEDLTKVKGIGSKTLEKNRERLTVGEPR